MLLVNQKLSVIESSKRLAAWTAVDKHILPEHKVIGIGSGTSAQAPITDNPNHTLTNTIVSSCSLPPRLIASYESGSTVPYVVERIVAQGHELNKDRVFIPTGFLSKQLIVQSHLRLGDVDEYPTIDVTIDGADE